MDGGGNKPSKRQVQIRRDGKLFKTLDMVELSGSYHLGRLYHMALKLTQAGSYEYRFQFGDASGNAVGPPTKWKAGPAIGGGSSAMVASLSTLTTAAGAELVFTLSANANVTATVVNTAGRPVRTIVADKSCEAGMQALLWDRRSDAGLRAPNGLYLIRVTARDEDGAQSSALATVALRSAQRPGRGRPDRHARRADKGKGKLGQWPQGNADGDAG